MLHPKHIALLTSCSLAAACAAPADEYRAALPTESDVTVEVPEQTSQSQSGLSRQAIQADRHIRIDRRRSALGKEDVVVHSDQTR